MFLDKKIFSDIIEYAPLISIELIVKNIQGQVLLGKRINEPAKDFWFVPGGRIYKDETLDDAFKRTVKDELGIEHTREDSRFHGLFEHFYKNNVFKNNFTTHYVALAHELFVGNVIELNSQHSDYRWFDIDELLSRDDVHKYTKQYFVQEKKV